MSATEIWSFEDQKKIWERGFGKSDGYEHLRLASETIPSWYAGMSKPTLSRITPVAPSVRAFTPLTVQTLMTDKHLRDHGVRIHHHDARPWLVSVDADTLVDRRPSDGWFDAVGARIDELRALAAVDEEAFCDVSAHKALAFARDLNAVERPSVFLIGNGNIRLLWTLAEEQIGLQFRGDGSVQYVLFARRGDRLFTHMGDDDKSGILRQITAAGLRHLLGDP